MPVFNSFDVLVPSGEFMESWPVVACDQFTSQPEYWRSLRETVGSAPSTLNCILPEAELKDCGEQRYEDIRAAMTKCLDSGIFRRFEKSFVYVERELMDGSVRPGLVGVIDLDDYDYSEEAVSAIRATEKTVVERIPPRMKVRRGAAMELSHVIMLCDDESDSLLSPLKELRDSMEKLYDQQLLQGGGRIQGWLVTGENADALSSRLDDYCRSKAAQYEDVPPMLFAVGDGNHSLATAKACYEELKRIGADADTLSRAKYAMVELENIHDPSQKFEPIHRLLINVDTKALLGYLKESCCAEDGYAIRWISGSDQGSIMLDPKKGLLPVGILQSALDEYLKSNAGETDYIHGAETLAQLAEKEGCLGFILPPVPKADFFMGIAKDGVLPRKTFSMGEAQEKRYYLEAREL